MTAIAVSGRDWRTPSPSLRVRWAWLGAWGPIRSALRRFEPSARRAFEQRVRELSARMVTRGISPRRWLTRGLPAAARAARSQRLAAALDLSARLIERGIDPGPALAQGLPVILRDGPLEAESEIEERLGVLERLTVRLATDGRVSWAQLYEELAPLAEAALGFHRQGIDWSIEVVPERGRTIVVEDVPLLPVGPPTLGTLYVVDSPRRIALVAVASGHPNTMSTTENNTVPPVTS